MIINHNMNAMRAYRNMMWHSAMAGRAMERLSTGLRINRAADDPAGLAISERMRGQIRGLNMASRNAQDGISLIQTAEGSLNTTHSILQRLKELATQAANDTNTKEERDAIQEEINQLTSEVNRIGNTTEFNTKNLLGNSSKIMLQVGANSGQTIGVELEDMRSKVLKISGSNKDGTVTSKDGSVTAKYTKTTGVTSGSGDKKVECALDVSNHENATAAIKIYSDAINAVSSHRSELGAMQNRLEYTIENLDNAAENLTAAESRIRDADMAKEMMKYTKHSLLQQVAQAMLAQASKQPNSVIELLKSML
ncbi:flagellin [Haloimpatiens sp. FM7330]|uniref:flagellin N-terminal helical domain-containing protein n=1 Tax=Haloimpatiens sp. FM7330 TaxID=3298610 RepID=UPI00363F9BBD